MRALEDVGRQGDAQGQVAGGRAPVTMFERHCQQTHIKLLFARHHSNHCLNLLSTLLSPGRKCCYCLHFIGEEAEALAPTASDWTEKPLQGTKIVGGPIASAAVTRVTRSRDPAMWIPQALQAFSLTSCPILALLATQCLPLWQPRPRVLRPEEAHVFLH